MALLLIISLDLGTDSIKVFEQLVCVDKTCNIGSGLKDGIGQELILVWTLILLIMNWQYKLHVSI